MSPIHPQLINQLIQQDIEASAALLALLEAEREALKSHNHRDLEQLVAAKSGPMQTLEANAARRRQLLQQAGRSDTMVAWEELLAATGNPKILDGWQTLKEQFAGCRRLNEVNGKLIARGQQTIARLLNILRGHTGAPGLYTQKGGTQSQGGSYTVVEA